MSDIKIEKGIPVPEGYSGESKYPFEHMAVGDSFAPAPPDRARVRAAAAWYAKRHPRYRFTVRTTPAGTRVWRIPVKED